MEHMNRPLVASVLTLAACTAVLGVAVAMIGGSTPPSSEPVTTGISSVQHRVAGPTVGPIGEQDGVVVTGDELRATDPDDADLPAIANLEPGLRAAITAATEAADAAGNDLRLTSGWRSARYQRQLLDEKTAAVGAAEARRWVSTPDESKHVSGRAVDVVGAQDWLDRNGAAFGLCRTYANESWHFERVARQGVCPAPVADATVARD
jgi:zinc D-Ala-D-Ala carboxypeptidase